MREDAPGIHPQGQHQPEAQQRVFAEMAQLAHQTLGKAPANPHAGQPSVEPLGDGGAAQARGRAALHGIGKINTTVPAANSVNSTRSTIRRAGVRSLSVRRPFVWFCCIIDNPFRANTFAGLSKKLHTGCGARGARFTVPQRHLHLANVGFAQQQHAQTALADAAADGQRQLIR